MKSHSDEDERGDQSMMNRVLYSSMTTAISVSLLMMPTGCATHGTHSNHSALPEKVRQQIKSVAVVPASFVPENNFLALGKGAGATIGTGVGAAQGALGGLEFAAQLGGGSFLGAIIAAITVPIGALAGAITGGVRGAEAGVPTDDVQKAEAVISNLVAKLNFQEKFAEHIIASGANLTNYHFSLVKGLSQTAQNTKYLDLAGQGVDAVLEVTINSIGFRGGTGSDPSIVFFMEGTTRVFQPTDGKELYSGNISYESEHHRLSVWCEDNAIQLQTEFEKAYSSIADQTIEELFIVYNFYPETKSGSVRTITIKVVDSLQPTLQWKALPWEKEWAADDEGFLTTISDITYDIKLWNCEFGGFHISSGQLVYEKQGIVATERIIEREIQRSKFNPATNEEELLPSVMCKERIAEHTIDISLKPSTCYVWSVRSKFKLNGQSRMTRWSDAMLPGESCESFVYPTDTDKPYTFRTPKAEKQP